MHGCTRWTHIRASITVDKKVGYIGRSGAATQNVLVICDFDMHFTYASVGQLGYIHDTNVLYYALAADKYMFSHPPKGEYFTYN